MVGFYDISKYSDVLFSYFDKTIPISNYEQHLKYRNRILLNSPEIHGPFKKLASLFVCDVNYEALGDNSTRIKTKLPPILDAAKFPSKQMEIFYNLFFYDYVVAAIFPSNNYKFTCTECDHVSLITENYASTFSLHPKKATDDDPEIQANTKCPECNKRTMHTITEVRKTKQLDKNPLNILLFNPFDVLVSRGPGGAFRVYFSSINYMRHAYFGLRAGADLTAEKIINFPFTFVKAVILNRPLVLNNNITQVFRHPMIAGLNKSFSPLMLSLKSLLHTNILRKGREAEALLKVDPHYMITPLGGTNSAPATIQDGRAQVQFTMSAVKQIKEDDSNGLIYNPTPHQAVPLFPEGRRWITSNELMAEEAAIINSTGFDVSVFTGGVGVNQDPFTLQTMEGVIGFYTDQMEEFTNKIINFISVFNGEFEVQDHIQLKSVTSRMGTQLSEVELGLIQNQQLPISLLYRKYGYYDVAEVYEQIKAEAVAKKKHDLSMEMELSKIEKGLQPVVMAQGTVDPGMMAQVERSIEDEAEAIAQELFQADEGTKKSQLDVLAKKSYVLKEVVVGKLRDMNTQATAQAKADAKQMSGGGAPQ
mgnify:CR=1 FL=1